DGEEDKKKGDEAEFDRETETRTPWAIKGTARNMALNGAVAGIYGLGYATIVAPWKAFELGLKYASQLTDNEKYTKGMMDIMFKKKREKAAKGEPKKEEWNKAKEYKVMQEVKKNEIAYIKGLKKVIIEQKAGGGMTPEEYLALTEDRKKELRDTKGKKGYENVWRTLRVHWIQEGAWMKDNEEEFRRIIEGKLTSRDFFTQEESNRFEKLRKEIKRLEKEREDNPDDKKIEISLDRKQGEMADLENRRKIREDTMSWPEYKRGKKKGGASAEDFVVTEEETEEDEDEDT
ncbi:MAG: hypothetical protein AAB975_04155, partial [Patescibacteria group bacterium]